MQKLNRGKTSWIKTILRLDTDRFDQFSPLRFFIIIISSVFIAEVIAMIVVSLFLSLPYYQTTLIDAGIMVILIFPILYWFSFHPLIQHIERLKQTEQKIELERVRLRSILDTMPDGIYIVNQQYDVEYVNPVVEREFGPVAGRRCYAYLHDQNEVCSWCKNPLVFEGKSAHWEWSSPKTGKIYEAFDTPLVNTDGSLSKLKVMHDITERKQNEERVLLLSSIVEQTADTVVVTNCDGVIEYVNPAFEQLTGYTKEEALGQTPRVLKSGVHDGQFYKRLWDTVLNGEIFHSELTNRKKNGDVFHEVKTITPLRNAQGEITHFVATGKDITERKEAEEKLRRAYDDLEVRVQNRTEELRIANSELEDEIHIRLKAEQALQQSEQRLKRAQEIAHLGSWELDLLTNQLTWSDEVFRIFGLQSQEFDATYEAFLEAVHPDDRAAVDDAYSGSIRESKDTYEIEHRVIKRSTGEIRIVHEKCEHFRDETGKIIRSVGMVHDITDRKQAEEALQRNEAMLRAVLENMPSGVTVRDAVTGELILSNVRSREIMGTLVDTADHFSEYHGLHADGSFYRSEEWPVFRSIATGEQVDSEEIELERNSGIRNTLSISSAPIYDAQGHIISGVAVFQDITERKRAERELQQLNRTLQALSASNQAMMRATNETELLDEVCRIVVKDCGHAMVWIGYAEQDEAKSVRPIASAGFDDGYLKTLKITWADTERGRGPTGTAIRTGKPRSCRNMLTDPQFAPWREQALQRGYASSIALPLVTNGQAFGAMTIYAREPAAFSVDEENLLTELASDLTHGIETIRLREVRAMIEAQLRLARDELEIRVEKRTAELAAANRELSGEIAERKEVERQLRIQTAAMDAAANGIIITDPNGIILWINSAITEISGFTEQDLVGQSTRIFKSGRQNADYYREMWETILAGNVWHGETVNRRKDGGYYVEEQTITPVPNENGVISHFIAIKQDITERKLIYSQLEDSNRDLKMLTASERQQRFLAEGLVESSAVLNMSLELHAVLDHIFEQTRRTIPYLMADIVLIDGGDVNVVRQWGFEAYSGERSVFENTNLKLQDFPMWERIYAVKSAIMIADTQLEDQWSTYFGMQGIRSYLGAPLIYGDQVIGIINLTSDQAGAFHQDMVKTLRAFAAPAAVAIQNARLYENEQQNRKTAEILSAASVALAQTLDIQMVMETILDYVEFVMPSDVAFVILSEGDERYKIRAVRVNGDDDTVQDSLQDQTFDVLSEPIIRSYFAKYETTYIPDSRDLSGWNPPIELASLNCWLGIPLGSMGKVLGVIVVCRSTPNSFTKTQIQIAEALVKQAVVALQNAWLFEQVRSGRERLQQLSRHLVEIQENERKYIARELHDETSQSLTSLKLGLQVIEQNAAGHVQLTEQVRNLKSLADETLESLHHLAVNLRPASLDHLGLVDALTGLIESTRQRSGLTAHFKTIGSMQKQLIDEIETSIYRIVQESITNVVRHAHATYVDVILEWKEDRIVVIIEDDGVGMDLEAARESGRLGLIGMQERAEMLGGKLLVDSTPQIGTTLVVEIPYVN